MYAGEGDVGSSALNDLRCCIDCPASDGLRDVLLAAIGSKESPDAGKPLPELSKKLLEILFLVFCETLGLPPRTALLPRRKPLPAMGWFDEFKDIGNKGGCSTHRNELK